MEPSGETASPSTIMLVSVEVAVGFSVPSALI